MGIPDSTGIEASMGIPASTGIEASMGIDTERAYEDWPSPVSGSRP